MLNLRDTCHRLELKYWICDSAFLTRLLSKNFKMLTEVFLPYVTYHMRVLKFLKAAPYNFNKTKNQVTIGETKIARRIRLTVQTLQWAYLLAMFTVVYALHKNKCYGKLMEAVMLTLCTINLLLFSYGWDPNVETVALLNALVKFDMNLDKSNGNRTRKTWMALKLAMFLISTVPISTYFCFLGRFLLDPCAPPFLGSILLNCPAGCGAIDRSQIEWYMWVGIISVDTVHVFTAMYNGLFYSFYVGLVTIYALLQYVTALANSRIGHGFQIMRRLQLLELMLNDFGKFRIIPSGLGVAPMTQIFALLTMIKFHDRIPLPGLLLFPIGYLTVMLGLSVFETLSGFLVTRSKDVISAWTIGARRRSLQRRRLRSLQSLKIRFWNNFLDRLTTLVTHNFCLQQTASLLIMYDTEG